MTVSHTTELAAIGVTVTRAGRRILDAVTVNARPGTVLAVTGPSGSGKSTLLAVLAGLVQPDTGTLTRPDPVGDRSRTGIVLQGYGLLPVLTAAENVELPLQLAGHPREQTARRGAAALDLVGLTGTADRLTEELSGGQQQRVAIARALVIRTLLLIADEPTAELDEHTATAMLTLLRTEAAAGATVVISTHDPAVSSHADRQIHLLDGRVTG